MSRYSKKVRQLQRIQLVAVITLLVAFIIFAYFIFRPKITKYDVRDDCGQIGGQVSHLIDDEFACKNACTAYCLSLDKEYHKSEFTLKDPQCNECGCFCKE